MNTEKNTEVNMDIRSEVLEYSLQIEDAINDLLLLYLDIDNKSLTRLFSHKGKLTLQGKINLLRDMSVLSKDEAINFELFMNLRNKFIHVIDCNSYTSTLNNLKRDISNRFKKYIDKGAEHNEESYRKGYENLYRLLLGIFLDKTAKKRQSANEKTKMLISLMNAHNRLVDLSFSLIDDLLLNIESSSIDDYKATHELKMLIASKCAAFGETIKADKEYTKSIETFTKTCTTENIHSVLT